MIENPSVEFVCPNRWRSGIDSARGIRDSGSVSVLVRERSNDGQPCGLPLKHASDHRVRREASIGQVFSRGGAAVAGDKDIFGLWACTGGEGVKLWMSVLTDGLQ